VTVIKQVPKDIGNAGTAILATRKPGKRFALLFNAIVDSLSNIGSLNHNQDVEDEEHNAEDSKWGKLTEYDNPDV
jgi:hypothetical protein